MLAAPGSGNVSLRTVSSSRPQLRTTQSQQSIAASDDYYSFSEHSSSSRSRTTLRRYATPTSQPAPINHRNTPSPAARSIPSVVDQEREAYMHPMAESHSRRMPGDDSYAGRPPTPGVDDSPYLRFAINQLTLDEEVSGSRAPSVAPIAAPSDHETAHAPPRESNRVWDDELGRFVRSSGPSQQPRPPSQQQSQPQLSPEPTDRLVQPSVDPEAFNAVVPPEDSLLYPPLDYVPIVLRPWALGLTILCTLLMIAGIVFSNVWSARHAGLWGYDKQGGGRYFVMQFLPQILAAIIVLWTFVIQAAVYRVMPFAIMGSERISSDHVFRLPMLARNFLIPDLSHFRHGEPLVGFSLVTIWLANFIVMPLLGCLYQAKWFVIDGQGGFRWAAVQSVGWTLVAIYALLTIGLLALAVRFARAWTGLMWDPVSLADLIPIIQRSNVLHDFEYSEMVPDVGASLDPRVLRLGYWKLSGRAEIFYGMGETDAPIRNSSLHRVLKSREKHQSRLSTVSYDVESRGLNKDGIENDLYSPGIRYRWVPWFLRDVSIVAWSIIIGALFIAFVLVSFIKDAVQGGFPPRLPTLPSTGAFSSSNFLYSFIPGFIGNALFLAWQPIDTYFRAVQPYASLSSSSSGSPASHSLLLSYPSQLPFQAPLHALLNRHYKVSLISLISLLSLALPILSGGVFLALFYPSHSQIRIAALMPAFYAIVAFCALYTVAFLAIWPRRHRYLPHGISSLGDQISFLYQSPLLADALLREPRSKADLVTRLVVSPPGVGEEDGKGSRFGFGVFVGRDGREHLGVDRVVRPGRGDMVVRTGL